MRHPQPLAPLSVCVSCLSWIGLGSRMRTILIMSSLRVSFPTLLPGELCYFRIGELVNDGHWRFSTPTLDSNNAERH